MRKLSPDQPIGIFDSGIGGLTVTNAIVKNLPNEEIVYFGDTTHLPYGDKSPDAIRYYCLRITKFLIENNCKLVVVACNSAASVGFNVVTEFFKNQALFVNVVDPLVKTTVEKAYNKVGVIATKATIQSKVYPTQLKSLQPDIQVADVATPLLGPMIEEGFVENQVSKVVLNNYLSDKSLEGIQAMLLACTHYPLIKNDISQFYEHKIDILDSTNIVADAVAEVLAQHQLLNNTKRNRHRFFVSDFTPSFEATTKLFYKTSIELEHYPLWTG